MNQSFLPTAYAATAATPGVETGHAQAPATPGQNEPHVATGTAAPHAEGLSIQPTTIAFQALNFILLLVILNFILYKPIVKLLTDREKRIKEGVENAEKAKIALAESQRVHHDLVKKAQAESQAIIEKSRQTAEEVRASILHDAQEEAAKIVKSGQEVIVLEKAKMMDELKMVAAHLVVQATEKVLRKKIDPAKDAELIEKSLHNYIS